MYDVIIIGAGVSGLFTALNLSETFNVLLLEAGSTLENRQAGSHQGFGGLGISEGKYNFSTDFGGALSEILDQNEFKTSLNKVADTIQDVVGPNQLTYQTVIPKKKVPSITFLENRTIHLGTKVSFDFFNQIAQKLPHTLTLKVNQIAETVKKETDHFTVTTQTDNHYHGKKVVIATGSTTLLADKLATTYNLQHGKTRLDLGIRLEMPANQFDEWLAGQREVKLNFKNAYTYCFNQYGRVITKRQFGATMPDGQNFREAGKTQNLNFTLFVPFYFKNEQLARQSFTHLFQKINNRQATILGQRLSAIDNTFLPKEAVKPSLDFTTSELSNVLPKEVFTTTLAFLHQLNQNLTKKIDGNTILYGLDAKFYQTPLTIHSNFESELPGLYFVGDSSGYSWSLSYAAASGIVLASQLNEEKGSNR
jgi:uncharacterized FAD-dependent dehydrogenase